MADLTLSGVKKSFGPTTVIHGVDLVVRDGEFVVFVGPSGCGKSTLLRLIAGLESVTEGVVTLDGRVVNDVPAADRGIAMVFQSYALYPHMSVYQNMAFGLENTRLARAEIDRRVGRAATMLRLTELLNRKPKALSGGQRQRVAIGRAIVREPKLFLFDEPLSNLDAELRVATRKELAALRSEISGTMIYVTHDQVEAMTLADRIVVLRAGRVEQIGAPLELYNRPRNLFVAGFIGSPKMNFLSGILRAVTAGAVTVGLEDTILTLGATEVSALPPPGAPVTIGIRPEHCELVEDAGGDRLMVVDLVERLGGETILSDASGFTAHRPGQVSANRGDRLAFRFHRERVHLFDENNQALLHGHERAGATT